MSEKPDYLVQGERARLFPILADTSKEGRTLSILLACMESVDDFGKSLLADLGIKAGARAKLETYTEVILKKGGDKTLRPDGLLILKNSSKNWTALVEAKVGNSDLTQEQLESYLEIAKLNGIDALITISNQFSPLPAHHPVQLTAASLKKATVLHWSWMYILTQATLQLGNGDIEDKEQRIILNEMIRFLSHPSAGVKNFDQMPVSWSTIASAVQSGGTITPKSTEVLEVVGAWYQEIRDLSLILSRQLGEDVNVKVPRAHATDPAARLKSDALTLASDHRLDAVFVIPNTAGSISVSADFRKKAIFASMRVNAPADRKSTKARLNWLLKQLQKSNPDNVYIRLFWPGRGPFTQHSIALLRETPEAAEETGKVVTSFEVVYARDLGSRFIQRRNFIVDLEHTIPEFYEQVGQHLKAWQPQAPKVKPEKTEPGDVNTEALREYAEHEVSNRNKQAE